MVWSHVIFTCSQGRSHTRVIAGNYKLKLCKNIPVFFFSVFIYVYFRSLHVHLSPVSGGFDSAPGPRSGTSAPQISILYPLYKILGYAPKCSIMLKCGSTGVFVFFFAFVTLKLTSSLLHRPKNSVKKMYFHIQK